MPTQGPTAAALLVGNELLSGKVQDQNLLVLAQALRGLGVRLLRVVMVADDVDTIAAEVQSLAASHTWVFTSGGVGPTHDDVTLEAVARAFGVGLTRSEPLASLLRAFYGASCTEGHLRMADVPEGTQLVVEGDEHDMVEVHGRRTPWPTTLVRNVFVMPGIPQVFAMKVPAARAWIRDRSPAPPFVSRCVYTDMDEGPLKPLLDAVVRRFPEVEIGSYPAWFGATYRTKLTFDATDDALATAAADAFCALLPSGEPKRRE